MSTVSIYALCEPGTRTVRYIGMTIHPEKRLREHMALSSRKKTPLGFWLRDIVSRGEVPNMITLSEVPVKDGPAEEIRYISAARTSLGMDLVNSTGGGEGCLNPSPELRAHRSAVLTGKKRTPEQCKNISQSLLGHAVSLEQRTLARAITKAAWEDPEYRAKQKESKASPESIVIRSVAAKNKWKDPKYASGHVQSMKKHWSDPDKHAAHSAATKIGVNTPEARANQSAAQKIAQSTPEVKAARSARMKISWSDPIFRAKTLAGQRAKRLEKKTARLTKTQN